MPIQKYLTLMKKNHIQALTTFKKRVLIPFRKRKVGTNMIHVSHQASGTKVHHCKHKLKASDNRVASVCEEE